MLNTTLPPLRPQWAVCPKAACGATDRIGVHSHTKRRYKCHACGTTFAETVGTPFYGLKHPTWLVVLVLTLLAYGCPIPAIVAAFTLDERTVSDWHHKAGQHAKAIQTQIVCQGQVDLGQVQGDELYVKAQRGTLWMATAMSVFSRLFLWGAIAPQRDTALITQVVQQVRAAAQRGAADPVGRGRLCGLDDGDPAGLSGSGTDGQAWPPAAHPLAGSAHCPGGQAPRGAQTDGHRAPGGPWLPGLRRGARAGDPNRPGGVQHGVCRTPQCDLAHVAARAETPQPHPGTASCAPGSRDVLDGLRLQLLSGAYVARRDTCDGGRSDRPCVVRG